jgi:alanyl-tRNA synthetase
MKDQDGLPCQTSYFDWRFGKLLPNHCGPRSLGLSNWGDSGINRAWEVLQHHLEIPINQIASISCFESPSFVVSCGFNESGLYDTHRLERVTFAHNYWAQGPYDHGTFLPLVLVNRDPRDVV